MAACEQGCGDQECDGGEELELGQGEATGPGEEGIEEASLFRAGDPIGKERAGVRQILLRAMVIRVEEECAAIGKDSRSQSFGSHGGVAEIHVEIDVVNSG